MKHTKLEVSPKEGVTLSRGRQKIVVPVKEMLEIALTLLVKVDPAHPEKLLRVY